MKELPDLKPLADADKDELIKIIQSLWDELQKLREKKPKKWGKDLFADMRSVVNTGKRQGLSAFQAISAALNPLESPFSLS
jgi:hypothetical protein